MPTSLVARLALPIAALALLTAAPVSPVSAQRLSGDYVLTRDGSEVLAVRLTQSPDGRVSGTASSGGASQRLSEVQLCGRNVNGANKCPLLGKRNRALRSTTANL